MLSALTFETLIAKRNDVSYSFNMPDLYHILEELHIAYKKHTHPPLFTCEDAEPYNKNMRGGQSKNLFLRNRKGLKHYLVVIESTKKADLKKLATLLNESEMSFASPERLLKHLGVTPGSVSPFALIHDKNKEVVIIVDEGLWKNEYLNFHPNINTETLEVKREDMKKFFDWHGSPVHFIEL